MDLVKFKESLPLEFEEVKKALTLIVESHEGLTINGLDDTEGYTKTCEVVKEAGKIEKNIEERRKELKAESLETGRLIDGFAKELQAIIGPFRAKHKAAVKVVDDHYDKQKAMKKAEEAWPARVEKLAQLGHPLLQPGAVVTVEETEKLMLLSDAEFLTVCNDLQAAITRKLEAENQNLRDEAAERDRIDKENKRIEDAKEQARKDSLQEKLNQEAAAELQKAKDIEEKLWPIREMKIRNLFEHYEVGHIDDRVRNLKALIVKMDEVAFDKYLAEAKESAEAAVARQKQEMGDREKMADYYKQLIAVPVPVLSTGSIYQSDIAEFLGLLRDGAQIWNTDAAHV